MAGATGVGAGGVGVGFVKTIPGLLVGAGVGLDSDIPDERDGDVLRKPPPDDPPPLRASAVLTTTVYSLHTPKV